jgi:hypothetical protein
MACETSQIIGHFNLSNSRKKLRKYPAGPSSPVMIVPSGAEADLLSNLVIGG